MQTNLQQQQVCNKSGNKQQQKKILYGKMIKGKATGYLLFSFFLYLQLYKHSFHCFSVPQTVDTWGISDWDFILKCIHQRLSLFIWHVKGIEINECSTCKLFQQVFFYLMLPFFFMILVILQFGLPLANLDPPFHLLLVLGYFYIINYSGEFFWFLSASPCIWHLHSHTYSHLASVTFTMTVVINVCI